MVFPFFLFYGDLIVYVLKMVVNGWIVFVVLISLISLSNTISIQEIKKKFGAQMCISGSLSSFSVKTVETYRIKESADGHAILIGNVSSAKTKEMDQSAMSKIHELAQYNEIEYFYKLKNEEGPPHSKIFTVTLTLGNEEYTSKETSLKKAQKKASILALQGTEYEKPLLKDNPENDEEPLTPTVLLNNLGAKLGLRITYFLINNNREEILNSNYVTDEKSKKTYLQKLNESVYSSKEIHIKRDISQTKGPFKVKVQVSDKFFYAVAHTIQSARHEAAALAVDYLIARKHELNSHCINEGSEKQCQEAKNTLKSPVSQVHEAAQLRQLSLEFEVVSESGPPHKRVFITKCHLGHLTTVGEGNSKKESKKAAAEYMLDRLYEFGEISPERQVQSLLKDRKQKKKKKKLLKNNFDKINMVFDNIVDSVLGYGKELVSKEGNMDNTDSSKNKKAPKPKQNKMSKQNQILELSNLLNFEVQFTDLKNEDQYYSLINLHINPEHICLGEGLSEHSAREKAAKGGLKLLYDIGFYERLKDLKHTTTEREVKANIEAILHEVSEETL